MTIDIRVRIDGDERVLDSVDPNWIHRHLSAARKAGTSSCVQVSIHTSHVNVLLATSNCPTSGGFRLPNHEEEAVLDLWRKFHLGGPGADLDQLWPFLVRLRHLLGLRAA